MYLQLDMFGNNSNLVKYFANENIIILNSYENISKQECFQIAISNIIFEIIIKIMRNVLNTFNCKPNIF